MAAAEIPSFRALCRAANVSEWAVQQLRRDRIAHMRVQTLEKLAVALKLSLPELLSHFGISDDHIQPSSQLTDQRDRITALEAEYQRLQTQLEQQEESLRQHFQQEVLTVIESWLLQWPTVTHAVNKNPELPAIRLMPLVQPMQNLLEQWDVKAIAAVGAEIPYSPQHHELMSGTAQPGDLVRVRYAGFVQRGTLLYRAKVSLVKEMGS